MNQSKSPKSKVFVTGVSAAAVCAACWVASAVIFAVAARGSGGTWLRHGDDWFEHGGFYGGENIPGFGALSVVSALSVIAAAVLGVCIVIGIVRFIAEKIRSGQFGYYWNTRAAALDRAFTDEAVLMGTVQSVDTEKSVFSVIDSDGNTKSVHINPLTKITKQNPTKKSKGEALSISNITEGAFVSIEKFNTETATLEAASVRILSEQ